MIVLALIPPLWRAVMDHRVLAHYGGDITLVNTKPPDRTLSLRAAATMTSRSACRGEHRLA